MMREAEQYAEEDHARREAAETRNQAEGLVYQTEKFLGDNAEKVGTLSAEVRSDVDSALADLKKALEGNDDAAIKSGTERLATASQALGAAMYATATPSDTASRPSDGPSDSSGGEPGAADDAASVPRRTSRPRSSTRRRARSDGSRPARGADEPVGPVVRDRRRLDPETGEVRDPVPAANPSAPAAPAEGDVDTDAALVAARTEAAERLDDLRRLQAEYVNYRRRVERDRELSVRTPWHRRSASSWACSTTSAGRASTVISPALSALWVRRSKRPRRSWDWNASVSRATSST